jgi:hypothetical protein
MTADDLITGSVLLMVVVCLLVGAAIISPPQVESVEGGGGCAPTYPGGLGLWILDGVDCWYVHTDAEFDAEPWQCQERHDGINAAEW